MREFCGERRKQGWRKIETTTCLRARPQSILRLIIALINQSLGEGERGGAPWERGLPSVQGLDWRDTADSPLAINTPSKQGVSGSVLEQDPGQASSTSERSARVGRVALPLLMSLISALRKAVQKFQVIGQY